MRLIPNADDILLTKLQNNSVQADFEALKDNVNNGYVTQYVKNMQSYICKIALIVSELCQDITVKSKYINSDGTYYPNALDFLCDEVIHNSSVKNILTSINAQANNAKHTTKTIDKKWIEDTLPAYNELIDQLIYHTKLDNFKICRIRSISQNSKVEMIHKPSMCSICKKILTFSQEDPIYKCSNCNLYVCEDCYSKQALKCNSCFQQEQKRIKQINHIYSEKSQLEFHDYVELAELGDKDSSHFLAKHYLNSESENHDIKKGIHYLIRYVEAEPSDAEALYNLGKYFSKGKGITKDLNSAENYYKLAKQQFEIQANNNSLRALYMLGIFYEKGYGCSKSKKKAISYYLKAANQGYADAELKLGYIYLRGTEVSKNIEEAKKNFFSAANHGSYKALTILKENFFIEEPEYLKLLEKIAFQGDLKAYKELEIKLKDQDSENCIIKLYKLYEMTNNKEKIAEYENLFQIISKVKSGDPESMYRLWNEYKNGNKLLRSNTKRQKELLKQSAEGNYGLAQYQYALTFKKNNIDKYIHWLQKATDNGIQDAIKELACYYEKTKTEIGIKKAYDLYKQYNETKKIKELQNIIDIIAKVESGEPESKYKLWSEYQRDDGLLNSDTTREQELLKQSADGNYGLAQYQYALTFKKNNIDKYIHWLQKAIDNNVPRAKLDYANKLSGSSSMQDKRLAIKYFIESYQEHEWKTKQKVILGTLGRLSSSLDEEDFYNYIRINCTPSDITKYFETFAKYILNKDDYKYSYQIAIFFKKKNNDLYFKWLEISAKIHLNNFSKPKDIESIPALELANMYSNNKLFEKALFWYESLIKYNYIPAMIKASFFYIEGKGCSKNITRAKELCSYINKHGSLKEKIQVSVISLKLKFIK